MLIKFFGILLLIVDARSENEKKHDFNFEQHEYSVKLERVELAHYNKEYYYNFEIHNFKYNRTAATANMTFELKTDLGKDLIIVIQAYKFMSNEYRYFPLRFQTGFCNIIDKNMMGLHDAAKKCGNFIGCPNTKGKTFHLCNFSIDDSKLPPHMPNGRYMMELQGMYFDTEVFLIKGYGAVTRPIVKK